MTNACTLQNQASVKDSFKVQDRPIEYGKVRRYRFHVAAVFKKLPLDKFWRNIFFLPLLKTSQLPIALMPQA